MYENQNLNTNNSAFKPYKSINSSSNNQQLQINTTTTTSSSSQISEKCCVDNDGKVQLIEKESSSKKCSTTANNQPHAYDYTIENLLNCSSTSSSTSNNNTVDVSSQNLNSSKTSSSKNLIPIGLIAQHLWWQTQHRQHFYQFRDSFADDLNVGAQSHVRRYLIAHHSPRQQRGPRRQRTTFTHEQTLRLEMEYHVSEYISRSKRFQLAEMLDLTENQIKIWFQNRRAKDKRIEKAIMEQQYRFVTSSTTPIPELNLSNCQTCSYTKQQFDTSTNN